MPVLGQYHCPKSALSLLCWNAHHGTVLLAVTGPPRPALPSLLSISPCLLSPQAHPKPAAHPALAHTWLSLPSKVADSDRQAP